MPPVADASEPNVAAVPLRREYKKAPLLEVVLEIRTLLDDSTDRDALLRALERLSEGDEERFVERRKLMEGELSISVDATGAPPVTAMTRQQQGHEFRNPRHAELFQARLNAFSYHKLQPYSRWEEFRLQGRRLWERYRAIAKPTRVGRIGLRYINRIDLPPGSELKDYLLTFPEIAPGVPQQLSRYTMQLVIPQADIPGTELQLRQGTVAPPRPDVVSVLLDIDLIQVLDVAGYSDELWDHFERLHARQNAIFEYSITDKTRALFA